jgi:hypothetical protein
MDWWARACATAPSMTARMKVDSAFKSVSAGKRWPASSRHLATAVVQVTKPIERVFEILNFYRGNLTKAKFGCGCLLDVQLLFGSATFCMTGVTSPGTKFPALLLRTVSSALSLC